MALGLFASPAGAVVYMTVEEALREAFPQATRFETRLWAPEEAERKVLEEALGRKIPEERFTFHTAWQDKTYLGDAVLLDEIGKHQPITFLFAINPDGTMRNLFVLEYRESRGSEIRNRGFRKQYFGKKKTDRFRIGKEVDGITGATLSCLATSVGARKALLLWELFHRGRTDATHPSH